MNAHNSLISGIVNVSFMSKNIESGIFPFTFKKRSANPVAKIIFSSIIFFFGFPFALQYAHPFDCANVLLTCSFTSELKAPSSIKSFSSLVQLDKILGL